ncbi:phospholipase C/P1 nuclease domain-containing protein [Lyophyllum atratum]|nr:phospholipase C/P1 nuclease domain-containing protein [Lyophyllum atratum]
MRPPPFTLLLAAASVTLPTSVLAWGAAGHEIVATIAQIHLHPTVFPALCDILNFTSPDPTQPPCHLAPIAAWADRVRYGMRWSAPLHYVGALDDHPSQTCVFPGRRGWAGAKAHNVLGAVRNVTDILEDYTTDAGVSEGTANEALKFLVHFLGDLHMPLHLTGRDRGGNSQKVRFGGRTTNLHSLWDGLLIAKAIRETPSNYTRPLPSLPIERSLRGTIYDSYIRRIMWEGVLSQWAHELPTWVSCPPSSPSSSSTTTITTSLLTPTGVWQLLISTFTRIIRGGSIQDETDDDVLCPYHWATPIHALNCDIVWPKELDEPPYHNTSRIHTETPDEEDYAPDGPLLQLDTPEYAGVISERLIIEKLLAQGGIRLAATLNWLFADFGDEDSRLRRRGLRVIELQV